MAARTGYLSDGWLSHLADDGAWGHGTAMSSLIVTAPAEALLPPTFPETRSSRGKVGREKALGQFYTRCDLAAQYYSVFCRFFDPKKFQFVEPSAGSGMFLRVLPTSTFGCDIAPAIPGIFTANFLALRIYCSLPTACIGNPPFGKNSRLAIDFFNRAADFSDVIAFIVPRTFRKASTINKLDDRFHLIHEELVPDEAFMFQGKPRSVPTVFQIWVREENRREKLPEIRTHRDFKFMPAAEAESADFALQRIGKNAGMVHDGLKRSPKAHYFIKGDVEDIMRELQPAFSAVAQDTAGKPSLSKTEIVRLYDEHLAKRRRARS